MKYMVEINAKFLVKIEIDGSCGSAEHYFLDKFPAVWGANAFDEKSMKTECFRGTLLNSELVSEKVTYVIWLHEIWQQMIELH